MNWNELKFWETGECQVIEERLDDLDKAGISYNPDRSNLFRALDETPYEKVKAVILGQDPYPEKQNATGIAFSIPKNVKVFPQTLQNIFREYCEDLHYREPVHGDLSKWVSQGVLLWNVIPTCLTGKPLSHYVWTEWSYLTKEILEKLSEKGIVFAALGGVAREYVKYIDASKNIIIETSHPSPRGVLAKKNSFFGSRLFSTINAHLVRLGHSPIDWRLT